MPNLRKKKRKIELPYWPSEEFIQEAMKMLKDKGIKWKDEEIRGAVISAYWVKRAKILAEQSSPV